MRAVESNIKKLTDIMTELGQKFGAEKAFRDWCALYALAIANTVAVKGSNTWARREEEFKRIMKTYDSIEPFARMSAHLVEAFEAEPFFDHLGRIYMELFGGNKNLGQCFTPYGLSQAVAQIGCADDITPEFRTLNDCACGGGVLLIAACEAYHKKGVNYQTYLKLFAEDLDALCVHMCYIQLSLIGARAIVTRRNTLTMESFERFVTPMEYFWPMTLGMPQEGPKQAQNDVLEQKTGASTPEPVKAPQRANMGHREPIQLRLFPEV